MGEHFSSLSVNEQPSTTNSGSKGNGAGGWFTATFTQNRLLNTVER